MTDPDDDLKKIAAVLFRKAEPVTPPAGEPPECHHDVPAEGANGSPDAADELHQLAADLFGWPPSVA